MCESGPRLILEDKQSKPEFFFLKTYKCMNRFFLFISYTKKSGTNYFLLHYCHPDMNGPPHRTG